MSKQAYFNLTAEPKPKEIIATVIRSLGGGLYQLRDQRGRTITARSTSTWRPTQGVVVTDGTITGAAGNLTKITVIEV